MIFSNPDDDDDDDDDDKYNSAKVLAGLIALEMLQSERISRLTYCHYWKQGSILCASCETRLLVKDFVRKRY